MRILGFKKSLLLVTLILPSAFSNGATLCPTQLGSLLGSKSYLKNAALVYDISKAKVSVRSQFTKQDHIQSLKSQFKKYTKNSSFSGELTGDQLNQVVDSVFNNMNLAQRWYFELVLKMANQHTVLTGGLVKHKSMASFVESFRAQVDLDSTFQDALTESLAATLACTLVSAPLIPNIWGGFMDGSISELSIVFGVMCGNVAGFSRYMLKQNVNPKSLVYDYDLLNDSSLKLSSVHYDSLLAQFAEEMRMDFIGKDIDEARVVSDMKSVLQITGWEGGNIDSLLDLASLANSRIRSERVFLKVLLKSESLSK
jgi:hypothetical protein